MTVCSEIAIGTCFGGPGQVWYTVAIFTGFWGITAVIWVQLGPIEAMPGKRHFQQKLVPASCSSPQLVDFLAWLSRVNCQCGVAGKLHHCQWVLRKAKEGYRLSEEQVCRVLSASPVPAGVAFTQSQYTSPPKSTVETQTPRWKFGFKSVALQVQQTTCEQAVQTEDPDCTKSRLPSISESAIGSVGRLSVSQKRRRRRRLLRQRRLQVQ